MKPNHPSTKQYACDALMFVAGYFYRSLRYEARNLGIRWTALMVLKDLSLLGPSTQRRLADIEQIREPTMTVLLRDMRRHGWVTQEPHPTNRRIKLATITPTGLRKLKETGRFLRQQMEVKLEALTPENFKSIARSLYPVTDLLMNDIHDARKDLGE
jgi:DNA-binding MarR family transcriptional regulator